MTLLEEIFRATKGVATPSVIVLGQDEWLEVRRSAEEHAKMLAKNEVGGYKLFGLQVWLQHTNGWAVTHIHSLRWWRDEVRRHGHTMASTGVLGEDAIKDLFALRDRTIPDLVRVKASLGQLGMFKSMRSMDEFMRVLGFELGDKIGG